MNSTKNAFILFILWFSINSCCAGLPETDIICGENAELRYRDFPDLAKKLKLIRLDCGQVCDTNIQPLRREKYYDYIEKNVDCLGLFESPVLEQTALQEDIDPDIYRPPDLCEIPPQLRNLFLYNGRVKADTAYINDFVWSMKITTWTKEDVENNRKLFRAGHLRGTYGTNNTKKIERHMREHMADTIKGGHILVIGSQSPWIEAMLLELGASNITTLEYSPSVSHHPQIKIVTPQQLNEMVMRGEIGPEGRQFDGVVTYSSLEHGGLGRYGDQLNPWADLIAMAKAWCLTKIGGKLLIGVPTGPDMLLFNACRLYGNVQYSHLFANWDVLYTEAKINEDEWKPYGALYSYEPIHILQKTKD